MTGTTLTELAGWDVPQLRGCVGTLGVVADRLLPWRARLDALGRELGAAECWSGPAGTVAAAALVELSTVASGVSGALAASAADLDGLVAAAAEAAERAATAQAVAGSAGLRLDGQGTAVGVPAAPLPVMAADQVADVTAARTAAAAAGAIAADALAAGGRAAAHAVAAAGPLAGLGVPGAGPVDLAGLVARLPEPVLSLPSGREPGAVADWWVGLAAGQQLQAIDRWPGAVGALDGLPAWARDRANRLELAAALRHLPPGSAGHDIARAVQSALEEVTDAGEVTQLLQFDPAEGLVAISRGDLDTAEAVGVLVPGINTTAASDLRGMLGDAADVAAAAVAAAPGLAVATVAWLGYRTPITREAVELRAARTGGPALDRVLDGLAGARTAPGAPPRPRVTVVGHSYGTVVTGQAARAPGRLAADAVVLLGSPGTSVGGADRLEAAEVHGAWSVADPISTSGFHGSSPHSPGFGDVPLPTELTQGHTDYYDRDRPTLAAVGEVVAGTRAPR
ncbi:alpha/beta hydrolase [Modestobacter italicus]|uniref:alpha/beta hydrolase n=1 Tax=Modestobacter italicus (strain DSM 44449 / CECT 9708 / BC 501) TaxID=2732864 RepID=UPI001C982DB2|nr:alpha/beta hydrolase [Modestobacter italicus]